MCMKHKVTTHIADGLKSLEFKHEEYFKHTFFSIVGSVNGLS